MVLKFHKILIQNIRLRERTSFQMANFHKHRAITTESMVRYGPLSNLKRHVTKFHKTLIENIRLRERASFQMVNFRKQRAITTERMVRYGPLSNLKKTSWY